MVSLHRQPIIVGNWKMYKTIDESRIYLRELLPLIAGSSAQVLLAVPFTAIDNAAREAKDSGVVIGAQNVNDHTEGAFTGEISCRMLKDAGASFVLIGHSERRHIFHESSAWVNKKVKQALSEGLKPIVCIGETKQEHDDGRAQEVLHTQLAVSLSGLDVREMQEVTIAYEPVWAIGANQAASPDLAQSVHYFCREVISRSWNSSIAEKILILYGGSVRPDNAEKLLLQRDVDGVLVGAASLSADAFGKIVHCCKRSNINIP